MDHPHALPQQVTDALARGWIALTANQRAARTFRHTYDLHQQSLGRANWEPPEIIAWDAWLGSLWSRLLLDGHASDLLLSPTQEHTVWRAVIGGDSGMASLRPIDSLAQTAASAWNLLHTYNAYRQFPNYAGNFDNRAFLRWSKEFERRCKQAHYLTEAQLPEALQTAVASGHFTLPAGLVLVGFDSKTPAQIALLEAIRATGIQIDETALPSPATCSTLVSAPDTNAELAACARWLRTRLTELPEASIAVIVPNIESDRAEIDRVFRQTLAPELEDIAAPSGTGPYEFSLGVSLASTPMVATALDILRWSIGPLALDRVSALLLSPYFAATSPDATELHARAEFDAFVLRKEHLLRPEVSADSIYSIITRSKVSFSLPVLLDRVRALRPLFNRIIFDRDKERTHAEWAAVFHELLEAASWAVPSRLDSIEFQTRSKWDSVLDELATLDFDNIPVQFASALTSLERIATETLFAPESRHAPVQIMGPLESAGSTFGAIWFLRANDLSWPLTPSPNPLLPWELQRDRSMPGANLDADIGLARRITERIAASAPAVVFSYALEAADAQQRPSPVVTRLSPSASTAGNIAPADAAEIELEIEEFIDREPIPLVPDRVFRGGAAILQAQAECGFRAFAEKRLFSAALESNSLGLSPGERGTLVHYVLQHFWGQVQSQAALKRMTIAERNAVLRSCIVAALTAKNPRPEAGWPQAYLDTERERLLNLLEPWLDYEANNRTPFTVKAREEIRDDVSIGPLRLNIRVDRVDIAHPEGRPDEPIGEIIIDYKTGAAKPTDWQGERPDAPQLPLYAVVSKIPNLAGVAFANLRPGKDMSLNGYQVRPGILPKFSKFKVDSLKAQVQEWEEILTKLVQAFHTGETSVAPKSYPATCRYCQQRLLCRLDRIALDPEALDDDDFDSENGSATALDPAEPEAEIV